MSSELFREIVAQYVTGLADKERELQDFRAKSADYIAFLEAEIESDRQRVKRLQEEIENENGSVEVPRPSLPTALAKNVPPFDEVTAPTRKSEKQSPMIREAAKKILSDAGGVAMMQNEIRVRMEELGYEIISDDANDLIKVALKRSKEFEHIPGKGWTLAR
ncbi:hypothetical protein MOV61_20300 [Neorhizobium sp. BETTINA12A]|uniref:hypothetical protein n=1 Tax=Neorhizobium sp. BETTINA12A TaxID=2908924 RepID=UPI001FF64EB1|nr:hypothetical protein [Neorhizobium sp. BETTINA12A]MCJ9753063.1 hypothetical protein [Neorhizobium sp. BETTINA12A]